MASTPTSTVNLPVFVFVLSFVALFAAQRVLAPRYETVKQRSWIVTSIASLLMTLASLQFLADFVRGLVGGSRESGLIAGVRAAPRTTLLISRFFQAYLCADLMAGALYYPSQVYVLSGWIHHTAYVFIVEYCICRAWAHIFCLCAFMELPTFLLGIASIYPRLRSDALFATTFFLTRICFHIGMGLACFSSGSREGRVQASLLAGIFPLHALWFQACVRGILRRKQVESQAAAAASASATVTASAASSSKAPVSSSAPAIGSLKATGTDSAHSPVADARSLADLLALPRALHGPGRFRFRPRRAHVRQLLARCRRLRLGIESRIPEREKVFEYVGLGSPKSTRASSPVEGLETLGRGVEGSSSRESVESVERAGETEEER